MGMLRTMSLALAGVALCHAALAQSQAEKACTGPLQAQAVKAAKVRLAAEESRIQEVVAKCTANVDARAEKGRTSLEGCESCSPSEKQENLEKLNQIRDRALAKCRADGMDARAAYLARQKETEIQRFEQLRAQFNGVSEAYRTWGEDAQKGYDETTKKIGEMTLGAGLAFLMERPADEAVKRMKTLIGKASKAPNVRRLPAGELQQFVSALGKDLKGKSKESARGIVLDRLRSERRNIEDLRAAGSLLTKYGAKLKVAAGSDSPGEQLFSALETSYDLVLTGTTIAYQHGVKGLGTLAKAAGVLALAPDALDAAALLLQTWADQSNLDGIDNLQAAANERRTVSACELAEVIKAQKQLELGKGTI